jgi:asparagine synthase (glutamine-hydrolysing)
MKLFQDGAGVVEEPVAPDGLGALDAALWVDSGWPLSEQLTMKLDKMTMAHSLEARVPYLDHEVFQSAALLPVSAKRRKALLREAAKGLLPPEILGRRKHGFTVPVDRWLRGELRPLAEDLLAPGRIRSQGIWRADTVAQWWREHLDGGVDRARQIWNLLAAQLWWEEMVG